MKAFKGNSYSAPIERDRKELGKYNEKLDQKFNSSRKRIAQKLKNAPTSLGGRINSTGNKRKRPLSTCQIIIVVLIFTMMFMFMFVSLLVRNPDQSKGNSTGIKVDRTIL